MFIDIMSTPSDLNATLKVKFDNRLIVESDLNLKHFILSVLQNEYRLLEKKMNVSYPCEL